MIGDHTKKEWAAAVVARLRSLLEDVGRTPDDLASAVHEILRVEHKTVVKYFKDGSMPAHSLAVIAQTLGIEPSYLLLLTHNKERAINPHGLYASWRETYHTKLELQATRRVD